MTPEEGHLQNTIYEAKRDGIVVNQGQDLGKGVFDHLMSRLEKLESRIKELEQS